MTVAPRPIDRVVGPFRDFTGAAASGGILLIAAAVVALIWANSPAGDSYVALLATPVTVGFGEHALTMSLHHWINDGLMAIFFFVIGLEIKREVLIGELGTRRSATLPLAAAVGGAVLPAAIFLLIVGGGAGATGWGIPMATDIAFALGILALLGSRAPVALKIFLTALAIVDDLLAVLVIAVFYTGSVDLTAIGIAVGVLVLLVAANRVGVRSVLVYAGLGLVLWVAVLQSGIHATVAGVLLALTIPARTRISVAGFTKRAQGVLDDLRSRGEAADVRAERTATKEDHDAIWDLESLAGHAQSPMLRLEHALHPWVSFAIVPVFALANAGVRIAGDPLAVVPQPLFLGILAGLVIGKQLGIVAAAWLVVRLGLAALPSGVTWRHIHGVACLAGIGFTMSLFIADLGLAAETSLTTAKLAILAASLVAGSLGYLLLRLAPPRAGDEPAEDPAD